MSKKLIITESEKYKIKSLYNINEETYKTLGDAIFSEYLTDKPSSDNVKIDNKDKKTTEPTPLNKTSKKGQELLNNETFKEKLQEISDAIHINKDSIIKLMKHESGLDPKIKNSIGCVGLIQFCPDKRGGSTKTVNGKQYSLDELGNNLELQMDVIKEFWFTGYKNGKIKNPSDLYIYNFFPIAAGKNNDFVLQTKNLSAETIARKNPIFNRKLGKGLSEPLTVGDLNRYYKKTGMI